MDKDEWIKKLGCTYAMEYYSVIKKGWIWISSSEVDERRTCYTEWNKSEKEKQVSYINAYIWNLEKWYWWTYLQGSNGDTNIKRVVDTVGGKRGMDKLNWSIHIATCKTAMGNWSIHTATSKRAGGIHCATQGAQPSALWHLEGWDGVSGLRGRGHMYTYGSHVDVWQKLTQYHKLSSN